MSTRDRLAKLLNEHVPEYRGVKIEWRASHIWPAQGVWRKKRMDVQSWQATAFVYGTEDKRIGLFGCWETMTECLKSKYIRFSSDGETLTPDRKIG